MLSAGLQGMMSYEETMQVGKVFYEHAHDKMSEHLLNLTAIPANLNYVDQ